MLTMLVEVALVTLVAGCSSLGSSGPTAGKINRGESAAVSSDVRVVELTDAVARRVLATDTSASLVEALGNVAPVGSVIGRGDVLDISIWEAPPAALFGTVGGQSALPAAVAAGATMSRSSSFPEQMVDEHGQISIPFAGTLAVDGKSPQEVARAIEARLAGKAHLPQVVVRVTRQATALVTVVGDVANSTRVSLSAKGERVLDAIASAGGVKQPVGKTVIRITRGATVASAPLERVLLDPQQNITLQSGDVVTALFQPFSFTALGAIRNNAEIPFEGTGLTLAQALGRIGGLDDNRADIRGVFIFRFENPAAIGPQLAANARTTPDGRVAVVYRLNLSDPGAFFVAQGFALHDKDVVYVSNAPGVDIQKFVGIVSQTAFSIIGIANQVK